MVKIFFGIVHVALVTLIVFSAVRMFYGVATGYLEDEMLSAGLRSSAGPADSGVSPGDPGVPAKRSHEDYDVIAGRDLFRTGRASPEETPSAAETDIEALEQTGLELTLWGTITGGSGEKAWAVIEDRSGRSRHQHLYRSGDRIGDALIKMVLREKVVLSVDGRDEVLEMEHPEKKSARQADSGIRRRLSPQRADPERAFSIHRSRIDDALSDVGNLMRQVRIRPYFEDGNPQGVLLSGIRRDSIFEEMGLQSGDVVKGVNGNPIRSVDDAMEFYQQLRDSRSVQVEIERDGSLQTISYRIE